MNASNQGFRNQQKGQKERKKERNNGKRVQSRQHVLSQRKSVAFVLSLASLSLSLSLRREDADQKTMEPLTHSQTHTHTHTSCYTLLRSNKGQRNHRSAANRFARCRTRVTWVRFLGRRPLIQTPVVGQECRCLVCVCVCV